jgi:hypothetical protein
VAVVVAAAPAMVFYDHASQLRWRKADLAGAALVLPVIPQFRAAAVRATPRGLAVDMTGPAYLFVSIRRCTDCALRQELRNGVLVVVDGNYQIQVRQADDTARPFVVTVGQWQAADHDEAAEMVDAIGSQPGIQITLCAMVNSDYDHLVLGHLALGLARRYDALVDLCGPLPVPRLHASTWPHSWQDEPEHAAATRTVIASLPGRVYEIAYRTVTGGTWVYHLVDARFLAEWLAHPDFRMVK